MDIRVGSADLNHLLGLIEQSRGASDSSTLTQSTNESTEPQNSPRVWRVDASGSWIETAYLKCDDELILGTTNPIASEELWNRNHNFWVDRLKADTNGGWTEQQYFDAANIINSAEYERVSFGHVADALISQLAGANDDDIITFDGNTLVESLVATSNVSHTTSLENDDDAGAPRGSEANGRPLDSAIKDIFRGATAGLTAFSLVRADMFARAADSSLRPAESWSGADIGRSGEAGGDAIASGSSNGSAGSEFLPASASLGIEGVLGSGGSSGNLPSSGLTPALVSGASALELLAGTALLDEIANVTVDGIVARSSGTAVRSALVAGDVSIAAAGGVITGTAGNDVLVGSDGDDVILGGDGDDLILGDSAATADSDNEDLLTLSRDELVARLTVSANIKEEASAPSPQPAPAPSAPSFEAPEFVDIVEVVALNEAPVIDIVPVPDAQEELPSAELPEADSHDAAQQEQQAQEQPSSDAPPEPASEPAVPVSQEPVLTAPEPLPTPATPPVDVMVTAGGGNDLLIGQAGDDTIIGGGGDDTLIGGSGDDQLFGGKGKDNLLGGSGDDLLDGGKDADTLSGGAGDDILFGGSGSDFLDGGEGADILLGGSGNDTLRGGTGNDVLDGESNDDQLYGEAGDDVLIGGDGNDLLDGGLGSDVIFGGDGNDWLFGGEGDDDLRGNCGNDSLYGGEGNDRLDGGEGNDWIDGGAGNNVLIASLGDDVFIVSLGNDTIALFAGFGNDTVYGFDNSGKGRGGDRDRIDVSSYGFTVEAFGREILFADVDGGTDITIGGDRLRLVGVSASTIDFTDFLLS